MASTLVSGVSLGKEPRAVNRSPDELDQVRLRGKVAVSLSGGCEILAQPLCTRLADVQRSADSPYRGNAVICQIIGEHDCCSLAERICRGAVTWAGSDR
jgi:hypothetical protein